MKTTHGIAPYNCFVETCQYRCHTQKELRLHLVESHPNVRMSNGSFEIVVDCPTNDVNGEPLIINREGCIDPSVGHPSKQPINAPNVLYNGCMGHLESALQVRHDDHIDFLIDGVCPDSNAWLVTCADECDRRTAPFEHGRAMRKPWRLHGHDAPG